MAPRKKIDKLYKTWMNMRQRCMNKNSTSYKYYGARGIKVCERWDSYAAFACDMGQPPTPKHQIDRINVDGDYEPGNCRWATASEQALNKRLPSLDEVIDRLRRRKANQQANNRTLRKRHNWWEEDRGSLFVLDPDWDGQY